MSATVVATQYLTQAAETTTQNVVAIVLIFLLSAML